LRERLEWEKEKLTEIKGDCFETNRPKVFQSFDKVMSKEEKQAFKKVVSEEEQERGKIEAIRKKKEAVELERRRKLKNLNILPEMRENCESDKPIIEECKK
jgi:hypothetical protein